MTRLFLTVAIGMAIGCAGAPEEAGTNPDIARVEIDEIGTPDSGEMTIKVIGHEGQELGTINVQVGTDVPLWSPDIELVRGVGRVFQVDGVGPGFESQLESLEIVPFEVRSDHERVLTDSRIAPVLEEWGVTFDWSKADRMWEDRTVAAAGETGYDYGFNSVFEYGDRCEYH